MSVFETSQYRAKNAITHSTSVMNMMRSNKTKATTTKATTTVNMYDSSERVLDKTMDRCSTESLAMRKRRASAASSSSHVKQTCEKSINSARTLSAPASNNNCRPTSRVKIPAPAPAPPQATATTTTRAYGGVGTAIGFQVRHASGTAVNCTTANLLQYSTKTCWQSYARTKETIVLALCVWMRLLVYLGLLVFRDSY